MRRMYDKSRTKKMTIYMTDEDYVDLVKISQGRNHSPAECAYLCIADYLIAMKTGKKQIKVDWKINLKQPIPPKKEENDDTTR